MSQKHIFLIQSVPLYRVAETAALVVFERIGKCGGVTSEREVVRRIRSKHDRTAHVEAVEVALQRGCCHGDVMILKVIA